ncbi:OmpA family protein [Telluribacter sp.]|jgi:outer membrane protein OmpA-like peptidoglycan-associated protein|uniref:OmpA family protein n=1 Tax=Telluribacter sp. TaxID=1978767 RepID=UPI002E133F80|nr:OmpA family protein [Telluribacter sp.]
MQAYKQGVKKFENGEYDLAIKDFQRAASADYEPVQTNYLIAESYRLSNRSREAIPFYQKALQGGLTNAEARFYYAYALKAAGQYNEAREQFAQFAQNTSASKNLQERALREIETLKITDRIGQKKMEVKLENLPFNTPGAEFSSAVLGNELLVSAAKKEKVYKNNGQPMLGLYKVKIGEAPSESGGSPTLFSSNVFAEDANESSPSFTPDGKTMVFARGNSGKRKGTMNVDLYMSRLVNGQWSEPRYLPVNDSLAWDGSPAFSRDGKTLYFASDRAGGAGGADIYRTNMDASGRFSKPVNMGKDINTAGDEMFPYVAADGKLYFASDGHPGLGKLDIFVATRTQGVISIDNLGVPFNTPQDDFGLIFYENSDNGFFTSNREGGKGDDDIYYFAAPTEDQPDTTVIAQNDPTRLNGQLKVVRYFLAGEVLSNTPRANPIDSATVRILADSANAELGRLVTGNRGRFGDYRLEEGKDYILLVERKGYISKRTPFSMDGRSIPPIFLNKVVTDTTYRVTVRLDSLELNKTFVLDNIYYDLNKYNIRPDAAQELDKLVEILRDNPSVKIELSSHTDARATDAYNMTLSQQRAESAVNYIVSRGVDADRLTARGYGERQLIVQSARTEEEHQRNRRTEFTILSY